jgi:SpoVK/Ycf46/Vps4 family AAA+-type ATPase
LTNRPEAVDPALKERLNKKVTLSLPTKSQRIEHLKLNIDYLKRRAKKQIFSDDIDFDKIASKIDKKS